jgi:hypothetical protein
VAVITNGTPLWLQESRWSVALREFLQTSFGWKLDATCGTDEASQARYRRQLADAGFDVVERHIDYEDVLDLDSLVGALCRRFLSRSFRCRSDDASSRHGSVARSRPRPA